MAFRKKMRSRPVRISDKLESVINGVSSNEGIEKTEASDLIADVFLRNKNKLRRIRRDIEF